ncbi:hypothetical protein GIB67_021278 [Kingdonia uniflora]|uniref:Uncharacterized protein n=1 Tax=Kingdonia uniflora TaxID=39325 RepID=A0A7J7LFV2_9MAGN|nr:hypothetical protein GIB67_021278 [Kingdonia uniflora]
MVRKFEAPASPICLTQTRNKSDLFFSAKMVSAGIRPNSYTISGLLPACATVADLIYGKEIHGYALVLAIEEDVFISTKNTACCHAGMIDVGQHIFHLMSEEHGIEQRLEQYECLVDLIGRVEITAKHVFELEPKSAGSFLLMLSLYADNGNWGDPKRLKKVMMKKSLRRNVRCSFIGITT